MDWLSLLEKRDRFMVKVKTKALRTEIIDYDDEHNLFLVAVNAPPLEGKANAEVVRFFSKMLKKKVSIKSGQTSKTKLLIVSPRTSVLRR